MLPTTPITHLTSFASLIKPHLLPHDTINVIVKGPSTANSQFHGSLDMTFGFATKTGPDNSLNLFGTKGWVSVESWKKDGASARKVTLDSLLKEEEDGTYEETEESTIE